MVTNIPLAERLRPNNLDEYIGQEHLVGEHAILRQAMHSGRIPSIILWGPPGVGKTTLALLIARQLDRQFFTLSAVNSGVKEMREVISRAILLHRPPILFIDEIHRFSKSQQDSLLGAVEKGHITLIGATTENPSFEVIAPLLSRCQVYVLKPLEIPHLELLTKKAIRWIEQNTGLSIQFEGMDALLQISGGDARKLINAIELAVEFHANDSTKGKHLTISNENLKKIIQNNLTRYDKKGEMHYDIISAFIKSMRGSDPNAAVYYLARMVEAGEDPLFIARRMIILASEDIGNANPNALLLANACFDAVNKIGWPEGRIILAQTVIYLACSPKSNASYLAISKAQEIVRKYGDLSVPFALRNAPTELMDKLGYGHGYKYAHDFEDSFASMEMLPEAIAGQRIFEPGNNPREQEMRMRLQQLWKEKYGY
jgi:putative ATPase